MQIVCLLIFRICFGKLSRIIDFPANSANLGRGLNAGRGHETKSHLLTVSRSAGRGRGLPPFEDGAYHSLRRFPVRGDFLALGGLCPVAGWRRVDGHGGALGSAALCRAQLSPSPGFAGRARGAVARFLGRIVFALDALPRGGRRAALAVWHCGLSDSPCCILSDAPDENGRPLSPSCWNRPCERRRTGPCLSRPSLVFRQLRL